MEPEEVTEEELLASAEDFEFGDDEDGEHAPPE